MTKKNSGYTPRRINKHSSLYITTSGEHEYDYIENIIAEKYSSKIAIKKRIKMGQLESPPIPRNDHEKLKEYKYQILKRINSAIDKNNKEKSIVAIVIDRDKATHEEIEIVREDLMKEVKNITEHSIFILNSSQFENWLRHYFTCNRQDIKKHKDEMTKDFSKDWDKKYKGKHQAAEEKYFKENTCYCKNNSIDNYCEIQNEYSDFPYFFKLLDSIH